METIACSDDLLTGIAELTERLDLPTHIHTNISGPSVHDHMEAYGASDLAYSRIEAGCEALGAAYVPGHGPRE